MSDLQLMFPSSTRCGQLAALSFPGEESRCCTLDVDHPGPHVYPPRPVPGREPREPEIGRNLGRELCEILDINPDEVIEIRLQIRPGCQPIEAVVNVLVDVDQAGQVLTAARRYQLVPR